MTAYKVASKSIMHRYCSSSKNVKKAFRKPVSFTKSWDTVGAIAKHTKGAKDGSFWLANCPKGFRALGSVAIQIKNGKKVSSANFPGFRCIANKYA